MDRRIWTDERLDDRMSAIDTNFDRQFAELRELRADSRADVAALRADFAALQRQVTRILSGFAIGLLGVLAAAVLTNL